MNDRTRTPCESAALRGLLDGFVAADVVSDDEINRFVKRFVARARAAARTVDTDGRFGPAAQRYYELIAEAYRQAARRCAGELRDEYEDMAEFWELARRRRLLLADERPAPGVVEVSEFERAPPPVRTRDPRGWSDAQGSRIRSDQGSQPVRRSSVTRINEVTSRRPRGGRHG